jgi:hypothetical protein
MMCDVKVPLLLLCLAAGYGVLALSNRQERPLDKLGRWIGGLVLLLSLAGLIVAAIHCVRNGGCDAMGRPVGCVFSGQGRGLLGSASAPAPSNNNAVATTPSDQE